MPTPQPVREVVQQDYLSRQQTLEWLKTERQRQQRRLIESDQQIATAERELESIADWLRNNP